MALPDNIIGARIDSRHFSVARKGNTVTLCTEMSDLQARGIDPRAALYNDACDSGFVLVRVATGAEAEFYESSRRTDGDEVLDWLFKPTERAVRKHPELRNVTIVVFND